MEAACPKCYHKFGVSKNVSGRDIKCPQCLHGFMAPKARPTAEYVAAALFLIALFLVVVLSLSVGNWSARGTWSGEGFWTGNSGGAESEGHEVPVKYQSYFSELSFDDFDNIYSSAAQKGLVINGKVRAKDVGKIMRWTGYVTEVGLSGKGQTLYTLFKHKPGSKSDVTVFFLDSQMDKLKRLRKGDLVFYSGIIASSAHGKSNHTLKQGRILQIRNR